jgi:hypothetical protein
LNTFTAEQRTALIEVYGIWERAARRAAAEYEKNPGAASEVLLILAGGEDRARDHTPCN